MNLVRKIKNIQLEGGIHTFWMESPQTPQGIPEELRLCVKSPEYKTNTQTGEYVFRAIINPNRYHGYLSTFSEFKETTQEILSELGIYDYTIKRVDFRLDSRQDNYDELLKLNKLLILLLGFNRKVSRYQSIDPLTLDGLTTRIQNSSFEAENYNKKLQSNGLDEVQNRLELRKKKLYYVDLDELGNSFTYWCNRLNNSLLYYDRLQKVCNRALLKQWEEEKGVQVNTRAEFVRKYQQNIFTSKQLRELLFAMGVQVPQGVAYNLAHRNQIEFFSNNSLSQYIEKVEWALADFLDS